MAKKRTDDFDPMAVGGSKMAAAGDDTLVEDESSAKPERGKPNVAADHLRSFIERIENRMEEKAVVADEIKQIFGEVKGHGYDPKAGRRIIAIRAKDPGKWQEEETILDTYLAALGMI